MKVRVLTAIAVLALAYGAPPALLDALGSGDPPLVDVHTYVQHINVLTS
ncbi:hypothetical protein [Nonomuraea insulae]|uniref:Uncharacterized protein n=1 Tax=Nonomuraea insulae TaxID=1616787 RepID=A0ABW1DDR0_9ACTN